MMTSQILKSAGFTKTQKSRYLENETLFFLQIKKFINYTSRVTLLQKINNFVEKSMYCSYWKVNFSLAFSGK